MPWQHLRSTRQAWQTASPSKNYVTSKSPVGDIPVVTLIRTDTTLDHSQKAEKVCNGMAALATNVRVIYLPIAQVVTIQIPELLANQNHAQDRNSRRARKRKRAYACNVSQRMARTTTAPIAWQPAALAPRTTAWSYLSVGGRSSRKN